MITYFTDKNNKSKKRYKKNKTLTTILKSFDTFVIIATTSNSITLSLTGIGSTAIPISSAKACVLSIGKKVIFEIVINKQNGYKKQYERFQQTMKSFDKVYRISLQDNVIIKNEYETLFNIFTKYIDEKKIIFFINMKIKIKFNFFSQNKLKFQPTTSDYFVIYMDVKKNFTGCNMKLDVVN